MAMKSLEKINFRKKTEGILLLDITNWYWGQKLFLPLDLIFIHWFKTSHIYSGGTKYSPCVSKLRKLSEEYLSPQKTQRAAFFIFERTWAGEWFKILTTLKILKLFVHIVSL